jgi:hypothetical protein
MDDTHPVATRRATTTTLVVLVVVGGMVAGVLWGAWTGLGVACLALIGGGTAAWLVWPRTPSP